MAHCRFEVIALWEVAAEQVMGRELTGLYPLLPLMRWEIADPVEMLEQSQRLILEGPADQEARADAYVALRVLSGIKYPLPLVKQILHRRELMLESPVYREILEEGRQEGLREDILTTLSVRLGPVPSALAARVRACQGQEVLEALFRRALVVDSLALFTRELD